MLGPERKGRLARDVHILPIAREVDRAVLPFLPPPNGPALLHAHKVVLLVPANAGAGAVATRVERRLAAVTEVERHGVPSDVEHPSAGFQLILHQLSWLTRRELEAGNRVHINLTSGSKLMAFAAGLVGMAHLRPGLGSVYHVQPSGITLSEELFAEHGQTYGVQDIEELELIPVLLPEPLQMRTLGFLRFQPQRTASYRDLMAFLSTIPGSGYSLPDAGAKVRNWNNAVTTRMVRNVIAPLQEQGMVEVIGDGRQKRIRLTSRGLLYASIAGFEQPALRSPLAQVRDVVN